MKWIGPDEAAQSFCCHASHLCQHSAPKSSFLYTKETKVTKNFIDAHEFEAKFFVSFVSLV